MDIRDYLDIKALPSKAPLSLTFELTCRCNFSCKMCYVHSAGNIKKELTARQWLELAKSASEKGTLFLLLTGGEPLLREDFPFLYEELTKMGFVISVNTNGSLLAGDILRLFEKYPPNRLNISLYGAKGDTYLSLCESDSFERVKENILMAKKKGLSVRLNYPINALNCRDMEEICRFAKGNDLSVRGVTYMFPQTRAKGDMGFNDCRLSAEDAVFYRRKWREICNISDNAAPLDEVPEYDSCSQCKAGRTSYWIDCEGNAGACGAIPAGHSVLTLGFNEAIKRVNEDMEKIRLPKECSHCIYRPRCNVCAANCYCETGKFDRVPEYVCKMTKRMYNGCI